MGAGAFVIVLALVAAGAFVLSGRSSKALTVTLQPLDAAVDGPFTASVVTVEPVAAKRFANDARNAKVSSMPTSQRSSGAAKGFATRSIAGDTARFYGVDPAAPVCNSRRLTSLITADPATGKAWARTMGIAPSAIAETVDGLTPVLLGRDTAVTDHSYSSDGVRPFQAVLQAGTAVLIDRSGTPRVQCICGNPLAQPEATTTNVDLHGTRWDGFDDQDIAVVTPAKQPVETISGTDIHSGDPVTVGVGATASLDGFLVADDTGVSVVSTDGKRHTQVIDHPVANAFDDGAGGIVYQDPFPGYDSSTSDAPYDADLSKIMILEAGATEPSVLVTAPDATTGVKLWDVGMFQGKRSMLYEKVLITRPDDGVTSPIRELDLRDLSAGGDHRLDLSTGAGGKEATANMGSCGAVFTASIGPNQVAVDWGCADTWWAWFGSDLSLDPTAKGPCDIMSQSTTQWNCFAPAGQMHGDGRMLASHGDGNNHLTALDEIDITDGKIVHTAPLSFDFRTIRQGDYSVEALSIAGDKALLSIGSAKGTTTGLPSFLVDLTTWKATRLELPGLARLLSAPVIRPADGADAGPPSTSSAPSTSTTTSPSTSAPKTPRQMIDEGTPVDVSNYSSPIFEGSSIDDIGFSSPDGNIKCSSIEEDSQGNSGYPSLNCIVDNYTFPDAPTPASCQNVPVGWISNIISLSQEGPVQGACTGGSPVGSNTPTLPYGSTIQIGSSSCLMSQEGLLCLNGSDHGWLVSTSVYEEFR